MIAEDDFARFHLQRDQLRMVGGRARCAGLDPAPQQAVLPALASEQFAAAVLDGDRGLFQDEALVGNYAIRPRTLAGGERLKLAGRSFHVAYTPGHAQHHVCYLDEADGVAYVGDTAGVRVSGDFILAPTPPPDIDIEAWMASLDTIEAWNPVSLLLTHFGPVSPARAHIARFRRALIAQARTAKEVMQSGGEKAEQTAAFVERLRQDVRASLSEHEARATELAAPFGQLFEGLSRYWARRAA